MITKTLILCHLYKTPSRNMSRVGVTVKNMLSANKPFENTAF